MTENRDRRPDRDLAGRHDPLDAAVSEADRLEQRQVHVALRGMARGLVRPRLSPGFHRELRSRLAAERLRRRRARRCRLIMQIYWAVAATASLALLAPIRWPVELPPASEVYLLGLLFVTALLVPLLLVLRRKVGVGSLVATAVSGELPRWRDMEGTG